MTEIDRSNSLADLAGRIQIEHKAVVKALSDAVVHAMTAGDLLIEARKQVPHGEWLPWLDEHCPMSRRTMQLYIQLAEHRELIEKKIEEEGKCATRVAHLTLRQAGALCVMAGRIERLMKAARRAHNGDPEYLIDLCIEEGFGVIEDKDYDPFLGRSEAERRDWQLFRMFIGDVGGTHIEWVLQRPFQNVEEWLGPEGSAWRNKHGMPEMKVKGHIAWAKFKNRYAKKTNDQIMAEIEKWQKKAPAW
jgi:Protein of unknown function (DUF3102)